MFTGVRGGWGVGRVTDWDDLDTGLDTGQVQTCLQHSQLTYYGGRKCKPLHRRQHTSGLTHSSQITSQCLDEVETIW